MELEEAAKLKHEIKLAEAEFEMQKDILKVMENRIKFGDQEAAVIAVEGYKDFLRKQEKAKDKIIARADKKKREYLEVVKEIAAHNSKNRSAHARMIRIKEISKSKECINTAPAEIDAREYYVHQSDF